jgi:hypothetical protein
MPPHGVGPRQCDDLAAAHRYHRSQQRSPPSQPGPSLTPMTTRELPRRARFAITAACALALSPLLPRALVGRDADALFDGEASAQDALARTVAGYVARDTRAGSFHTGSTRFDGEWALVTSQMAALGLSQVILAHPELRARYLPPLRAAVDHLLRPETFAFGTQAWGAPALDSLDQDRGHAYLGYVALAMGALREVDPGTRTPPSTTASSRRSPAASKRSPVGVIETYPGEAYPCDLATVVGAIGQHARLTGSDRRALIARMAAVYRTRWIDPSSGYLVQTVVPETGAWASPPRGSGTALSSYFLSFADASLARELGQAVARSGTRSLAGFGAVAEYATRNGGAGRHRLRPRGARGVGVRDRLRPVVRSAAP